jgi:5'-3' exonuclease
MKTFILNDTMNVFYRSRHITRGDINDRVGMSVHVMLNSVRKAWREFKADHVVFCYEGRSWRKDVYKPYKANRAETRGAMTPTEVEEDKMFFEAFDDFKTFITEKTNCTTLQHPRLEADDLIAGWVQAHPDAKHIINSTDGDFEQLIQRSNWNYHYTRRVLR